MPLPPLFFSPYLNSFLLWQQALGILINLVERSPCNQDRLLSTVVPASGDDDDIFTEQQTTLKALIGLFINKEESARLEEARTDAILDGKPPGHQPESGSSQPNSSGNKSHSPLVT